MQSSGIRGGRRRERGSNFTQRIPRDRFLDGAHREKQKYCRNSIDNSNRVSSNYRKIKYRSPTQEPCAYAETRSPPLNYSPFSTLRHRFVKLTRFRPAYLTGQTKKRYQDFMVTERALVAIRRIALRSTAGYFNFLF